MPFRVRHLVSVLPVAAIAFSTFPASVWAQESAMARSAVQERKFGFSEEIRLSVGSMPLDPYQKGWTGSLSFTHHFSDLWAFEIVQVTGALLTSTSLRDELIGTFARRPEEFSAPRLMATTGIELSPLYGKQVLFNRDTVHSTFIFGGYLGVIFGDRPTFSETLEDLRPSAGGGLGFRVHLSRLFSTRIDARLFASLLNLSRDESVDVETVALFSWSISFGFGGRP